MLHMADRKLGVAVFGVGRIGKVHLESLVNRIPEAELITLADVGASALANVAARFGIGRRFADYRDALKLPEVDAVVICTPTTTHYDAIFDAASAGKQIFCEKPLELTIERIAAINAHVAKCGVQLMVGFNRRFDPSFLKMRETVQAGGIGAPEILRNDSGAT